MALIRMTGINIKINSLIIEFINLFSFDANWFCFDIFVNIYCVQFRMKPNALFYFFGDFKNRAHC